MSTFGSICFTLGLLLLLYGGFSFACCSKKTPDVCYCDSSVGRNVLNTGEYSSSYCTRRAVMNLQKFEGCCMWHGGVAKVSEKGGVQCKDGSRSELCTLQMPHDKAALY
jgi:hypothetical protein